MLLLRPARTLGCALMVMAGAVAAQAPAPAPPSAKPAPAPKAKPVPKARPSAASPAAPAARAEPGHPYHGRAELRAFADEVAARRGWDPAWVMIQLDGARQLPRVARLIMPPAVGTAKNWAAYRDRFIEPQRIQGGVAFWQANERTLQRAEAQYGVPAEIVVGIIGVETFYGRITGDFRVLDALATLSFDFPRGRSDRSAFFRTELEELLVLARREGVRADTIKGSYAGAIGWAQFLPGSINRHGVDFDGDGHVDLQRSVVDAIGSVAHYLQDFGWQRGQPTHHAVQPPAEETALATLLAPDILPSFSAARLAELGARLDEAGRRHEGPLALVELRNGDSAPPTYIAGTQNFYTVTRYNWSSYYALAVISLAEAVKAAREVREAAAARADTGARPARQ